MQIEFLGDSDPGGSPVVDTDGIFLAYGVSSTPGTAHVVYLQNLHAPLLTLHTDLIRRPISAICLCHAFMGSADHDVPSPQSLLCAGSSDAVVIWSLPSAYEAAADGRAAPAPIVLLEGIGQVDAIVPSTRSEAALRLAVLAGTEVFVFELQSLRNTHRLQGHAAPVISACFFEPHSPHVLVTCGEDRRFFVWDLDQSTSVYQSSVLTASPLISLAVDPTFPRLAVGAADGVLRFFDLSSLPAARLIQTVDVAKQLQKIAEKAERIAQSIRSQDNDGPVVVTAASNGVKKAVQGYMAVSELAVHEDAAGGGDEADEGSVAMSGSAILSLLYTTHSPPDQGPNNPLPFLVGPSGRKAKLLVGTTRALVLLDASSFEIDEAHYLRGGVGGNAALALYHKRPDNKGTLNPKGTPSALKLALDQQLSQFHYLPEASKAGGIALSFVPHSDEISVCISPAFEPQISIFSLQLDNSGKEEEDPLTEIGNKQAEEGVEASEEARGGITVFLTKPLPPDSPLQLNTDHQRASTSGASSSSSRKPSPQSRVSSSSGSSLSTRKSPVVNQPVTFHKKVKSSGYGFVQPQVKMGSAPPQKVKVTKAVATSQVGRHLLAQRQYPSECGLLVEPTPSVPAGYHASAVLSLSYSSDASRLLSSSADKTARAMKLPLSKHQGEGTDFIGHNSAVVHSSFSHDGTMCLTSADRVVKLWNAAWSSPLISFTHTLRTASVAAGLPPPSPASSKVSEANRPFLNSITAASFCWMDSFVLLATGPQLSLYRYKICESSENDLERLRNNNKYKLVASFTSSSQAINSFSCINSFLSPLALIAGSNRSVQIIDLSTMQCVSTIEETHQRPPYTVIQADSSLYVSHPRESYEIFATAAQDNTAKLWDVRSSGCIRTFAQHKNAQIQCGLALSPCLRYLAAGSEDKSYYLYDLRMGSLMSRVRGVSDAVTCLAFNPLHPQMAVGCLDGKVLFFNETKI